MAPSKSHQEHINKIPLKTHYPLWQARRVYAHTQAQLRLRAVHMATNQPTKRKQQATLLLHVHYNCTTAVQKGRNTQQKPRVGTRGVPAKSK